MIYSGLPNKAISIRQPWTFCIMELAKDIENRDWYTSYRGEVCVHAAKGMTNQEYEDCLRWVHHVSTIRPFKPGGVFPAKSELLRGGIVGTVEIIDCIGRSDSPWFFGKWDSFSPTQNRLILFRSKEILVSSIGATILRCRHELRHDESLPHTRYSRLSLRYRSYCRCCRGGEVMANYRTCNGCAFEGHPCKTREAMSNAIRGLHITSIKWRCKDRRDAYEQGEPVFVSIIERYEGEDPYITDVIATCIGMRGRKVHRPTSQKPSRKNQEYSFARMDSSLFRVIMFGKRGGEFEPICQCGRPYRIDGHEEHCEHHPDFSKQFEGWY